jgi:hypothetical protein
VLGAKSGTDDARVERRTFLILLKRICAFLHHALHPIAMLAGGLLSQDFKYPPQTRDLFFCFVEVCAEK